MSLLAFPIRSQLLSTFFRFSTVQMNSYRIRELCLAVDQNLESSFRFDRKEHQSFQSTISNISNASCFVQFDASCTRNAVLQIVSLTFRRRKSRFYAFCALSMRRRCIGLSCSSRHRLCARMHGRAVLLLSQGCTRPTSHALEGQGWRIFGQTKE